MLQFFSGYPGPQLGFSREEGRDARGTEKETYCRLEPTPKSQNDSSAGVRDEGVEAPSTENANSRTSSA